MVLDNKLSKNERLIGKGRHCTTRRRGVSEVFEL
jgi:hypothetical protein